MVSTKMLGVICILIGIIISLTGWGLICGGPVFIIGCLMVIFGAGGEKVVKK